MSVQESQPIAEVAGYSRSDTIAWRFTNALIVGGKGLQFQRRLSFEGWLHIGSRLSSMATSMAWCLGDWLIYGETHFTGRYRKAIEETSLDYQTLRNYAWVARKFALSRRRDGISFGHHAEVAALPEPEQDYWLRRSEESSWSRNRLRSEVRKSLAVRGMGKMAQPDPRYELNAGHDAGDSGPGSSTLTLNIPLPSECLAICEAAARDCGLSLQEWVQRALEGVARYGLEFADKQQVAEAVFPLGGPQG